MKLGKNKLTLFSSDCLGVLSFAMYKPMIKTTRIYMFKFTIFTLLTITSIKIFTYRNCIRYLDELPQNKHKLFHDGNYNPCFYNNLLRKKYIKESSLDLVCGLMYNSHLYNNPSKNAIETILAYMKDKREQDCDHEHMDMGILNNYRIYKNGDIHYLIY